MRAEPAAAVAGRSEAPIIRHLSLVAAVGLGLAVLWAPLPFGSVEPERETLLRLAAALLLALAGPAARGYRLRPVAVPALALAGLALLGAVQSLPSPPGLVRLVSPAHAEAWGQAEEVLALARDAAAAGPESAGAAPIPVPRWHRLSLDPGASRQAALTAAALAALLVAAALAGRSRERRRWLAAGVVAAALFQVVYGARQLLAGSTEVWGVAVIGVSDRLRGTYVNPNHAAYLLELALALLFAAGWWAVAHARRETELDRRLLLLVPPLVAWLAVLAGLALTRSRAGLVAALVAVAVQAVLAVGAGLGGGGRPAARRRPPAPAALAAGLVVLGILAGVLAQSAVVGRLLGTSLHDVSWEARRQVARLTVDLWLRFPVLGSGLGTFRDAFTRLEPAELAGDAWHHAHQDYLELAATGGLVAVALLAAGLVALVRRLWRVLGAGYRSEDRAAALAALGALAAAAVHEAFDFGLLLPANAFVLVAVCGAAAGARVRTPTPGGVSAAAAAPPPG